jgi:methyl-accepting chemotaxis protein
VKATGTFKALSQETVSLVQDALAVTEEQTASMQEIADASSSMAALSQKLDRMVSKFKF